jgi:hypothetical protein
MMAGVVEMPTYMLAFQQLGIYLNSFFSLFIVATHSIIVRINGSSSVSNARNQGADLIKALSS